MYNKKNQATNPQGGRVARSQREERYGQIPSSVPNKYITLDKETDTFNTLWSAEKCFYILNAINIEIRNYNEFVIGAEDMDTRFKKPLPYFKTLTAFFFWIEETNPKAVKEFIRELFLSISNADRGTPHPDSLLHYHEDAERYQKELSKYIGERVHLLANDDEEE